jgi:hypothetical protein
MKNLTINDGFPGTRQVQKGRGTDVGFQLVTAIITAMQIWRRMAQQKFGMVSEQLSIFKAECYEKQPARNGAETSVMLYCSR